MRETTRRKVPQLLYEQVIEVHKAEDVLQDLKGQQRLLQNEMGAYLSHARKRRAGDQAGEERS